MDCMKKAKQTATFPPQSIWRKVYPNPFSDSGLSMIHIKFPVIVKIQESSMRKVQLHG